METCEFQDLDAWGACTAPITESFADEAEVKYCQIAAEKAMAAIPESFTSYTDIANALSGCLYSIAMPSGSGSGDYMSGYMSGYM